MFYKDGGESTLTETVKKLFGLATLLTVNPKDNGD